MKFSMLLRVLIAMFLAIIVGYITGTEKQLGGIPCIKIYHFIGQIFLNALNLVVVPLVVSSIILGTSRMGKDQSFKNLGAKTCGLYILTNSLAIVVGLVGFLSLSSLFSSHSMEQMAAWGTSVNSLTNQMEGGLFDKIEQIVFKIVPSNILAAASQGQMLGLIVFSLLFGYFTSKIDSQAASTILSFWKAIFEIMMRITLLVMKALPIGVFGLVAKVVASTGLESITRVGWYFFTVTLSLLFYAGIILPLLLIGLGKVNPLSYFRSMAPALLTAFSTSSSAATMPFTMECLEKNVGVSNRICSFAIPLGTSLNMSGGSLYLCVASLFIAQVYGVSLSVTTIGLVAVMAILTSMGVAGIPSASLISVIVILQTIGVPVEGIGLIMAVDRILDMFRTTVNVLGNATCAVLLARSEGEQLFAMQPAMQKI